MLVAGAAAALVVGVIGLAVTAALLAAANARERAAKERAESQRDRADRHLQLAREAVDHFHTEVSQSAEMKAHGVEGLRTKLLEGAADYYERLVRDAGETSGEAVEAERGRALYRLANLQREVGRNADAERHYREAEAIARRLATANPANVDDQRELATCPGSLGHL